MSELPDMALRHLAEDGIFVLEHDKYIHFDEHASLMTSRKYGRTVVSVFSGRRS